MPMPMPEQTPSSSSPACAVAPGEDAWAPHQPPHRLAHQHEDDHDHDQAHQPALAAQRHTEHLSEGARAAVARFPLHERSLQPTGDAAAAAAAGTGSNETFANSEGFDCFTRAHSLYYAFADRQQLAAERAQNHPAGTLDLESAVMHALCSILALLLTEDFIAMQRQILTAGEFVGCHAQSLPPHMAAALSADLEAVVGVCHLTLESRLRDAAMSPAMDNYWNMRNDGAVAGVDPAFHSELERIMYGAEH